MNNTLMNLLTEIVIYVITGVVIIVAKNINEYISSKKGALERESEEYLSKDTVDRAIKLVQKVVDTTSQTYVDDLKKSGKFTVDAQKEAFNKSFTEAKNLLSDEAKEVIESMYSDIDSWLRVQIESYIKGTKKFSVTE